MDPTIRSNEARRTQSSYTAVLRNLAAATKDLFHEEAELVKEEVKATVPVVVRHSVQTAIFGALLAVSVVPFLAFLVIGLGELLNDNYWLSSLIVAVVCAAVGGGFAYRAFQKLKNQDLSFKHSREGIVRGVNLLERTLKEPKVTIKGENHEPNELH